jgi:hypothetical protein
MVFPFFFLSPLSLFWNCGSGKDEERSGAKGLRLIQIRLATSSLPKIRSDSQEYFAQAYIAARNFKTQAIFLRPTRHPPAKLPARAFHERAR